MNNMNMVTHSTLLRGKCSVYKTMPKGENSYLSTITKIMLALPNLMFLHFYDRFHIPQKRNHTFQHLKRKNTAWKTSSENHI